MRAILVSMLLVVIVASTAAAQMNTDQSALQMVTDALGKIDKANQMEIASLKAQIAELQTSLDKTVVQYRIVRQTVDDPSWGFLMKAVGYKTAATIGNVIYWAYSKTVDGVAWVFNKAVSLARR
jgi:hypothetical protein